LIVAARVQLEVAELLAVGRGDPNLDELARAGASIIRD